MMTRTRKHIAMALALILAMTMLTGITVMGAPISPQPYRVTFALNGGTRTGGGALYQQVYPGQAAVPPTVERTGYVFVGWDKDYTNITEGMTITARWGHKVNFTLNGGTRTGGGALYQVVEDGKAAVAPTLTRAGYTFAGWDKDFSHVTAGILVTAQWKSTVVTPAPMPTPSAQKYRITFALNGGTRTGGGALYQEVAYGQAAVPPTVARDGYHFTGWDKPYTAYTNVTEGMTITAQWSAQLNPLTTRSVMPPVAEVPGIEAPIGEVPGAVAPIAPITPAPVTPVIYTVTFNLAGGTRTGGGELVQSVAAGGAATEPRIVRDGYNFVGWDSPYGNVQGNITVTARWVAIATPPTPVTPEISRVTFNLAGGTRVGGGALTQAIPTGGSAVEPYVFRQGYIFLGWDRPFNNIRRDITVTAQWTRDNDTGMIEITPPIYDLVTGSFANNSFMQFSHMPLIYRAESHVATFTSVQVDGTTLTAGTQYVATAGTGGANTTAIHLKASFLNTLAVGNHTLRVNFKDGVYAEAQFTVVAYTNRFLDVSANDWFYKGVQAMVASGLIMGVNDSHFDPSANMTRGMVVTLLYRFTGEPSVTGLLNPFPDVAAGQYYTNAVLWAAANGIVTGHDTGMFAPQDIMTREQFAAVLYRYQNALGSSTQDVLMDRTYSDFGTVSNFAQSSVTKLTMQGVFRDWPYDAQNRFQPKANITRAEVATVLRYWIESIGW